MSGREVRGRWKREQTEWPPRLPLLLPPPPSAGAPAARRSVEESAVNSTPGGTGSCTVWVSEGAAGGFARPWCGNEGRGRARDEGLREGEASGRRGRPSPEPLWERRANRVEERLRGAPRRRAAPEQRGVGAAVRWGRSVLPSAAGPARSPLGSFCLGSAPFTRLCRRPPPSSSPPSPRRPGGGGQGAARAWRCAFKREPLCTDGWDLKFSLPPGSCHGDGTSPLASPTPPTPPSSLRGCPGAVRSPSHVTAARGGRVGESGAPAASRRRSRAVRPGSGPGGAGAAARLPVPACRARQRSPRGIRYRHLRWGRAELWGFCCLYLFIYLFWCVSTWMLGAARLYRFDGALLLKETEITDLEIALSASLMCGDS